MSFYIASKQSNLTAFGMQFSSQPELPFSETSLTAYTINSSLISHLSLSERRKLSNTEGKSWRM